MAHAGGKIILFGEHAVVYGTPAIAAAIEVGARAEVQKAECTTMHVKPWDVEVSPDCGEPLGDALAAVLSDYPGFGVRIDASADIPGGAGLGCSAALGVAVIKALDEFFGVERSPEERAIFSMKWEGVFHGNPSGVDNTVASCGGVVSFRKPNEIEPLKVGKTLTFVVAHSGVSSSTKTMVDGVRKIYEREPETTQKSIDAIEAIVVNARRAIEDGDEKKLGQLMEANHLLLGGLFVSSPELEHLCAIARKAGAFGAKLTGAGGGGCMIALCPEDKAEYVRAELAKAAEFTLITRIDATKG